jgi:acyl-CoA reductase-like NAD-dependent aldehyde dehydrogenase
MAVSTATRYDYPTYIDGEEVWGDQRFDVRYPYTGEVIGSAPRLSRGQVESILTDAAKRRFDLSRHERATILNRIADRLEAEAEDFARLITSEAGLCLKDTNYELKRAQDVFRFSAMEALRDDSQVFACDTSANGKKRRAYTIKEPLRLVAAITPFNHPLNQVAHKVAPSIATNNVMVLKPTSRTPLSALRLARIAREAGLPDGMLTMVTGQAEEIGPVMWTHPDVELVSLTGGTEIGKRIAREMGYKRAILELGGNDPLIVLGDADLDEAVRLAVYGAFKNSGQRCTAVKRIIVVEHLADIFAEKLVTETAKLVVGDPMDPATDIGTVIAEADAIEFERRKAAPWRSAQRRADRAGRARPRHAGDGDRLLRDLRPLRADHPRQGPGRGDCRRQRHRVRPFQRCRHERSARDQSLHPGAALRLRQHPRGAGLPHRADTLRRHEGQRTRRQGGRDRGNARDDLHQALHPPLGLTTSTSGNPHRLSRS